MPKLKGLAEIDAPALQVAPMLFLDRVIEDLATQPGTADRIVAAIKDRHPVTLEPNAFVRVSRALKGPVSYTHLTLPTKA